MNREDYRWFIGLLGDGTYRFIIPSALASAEAYIGKHGGAVYTHAGYLIFAANKQWWRWLTYDYQKNFGHLPPGKQPPHIDVPSIECSFSDESLRWLKDNEKELKNIGGKYYDFIPRH